MELNDEKRNSFGDEEFDCFIYEFRDREEAWCLFYEVGVTALKTMKLFFLMCFEAQDGETNGGLGRRDGGVKGKTWVFEDHCYGGAGIFFPRYLSCSIDGMGDKGVKYVMRRSWLV